MNILNTNHNTNHVPIILHCGFFFIYNVGTCGFRNHRIADGIAEWPVIKLEYHGTDFYLTEIEFFGRKGSVYPVRTFLGGRNKHEKEGGKSNEIPINGSEKKWISWSRHNVW